MMESKVSQRTLLGESTGGSVKVIGDAPKYVALTRPGKSFFFTRQARLRIAGRCNPGGQCALYMHAYACESVRGWQDGPIILMPQRAAALTVAPLSEF
jgi:hypothetical protein